MPAASLGRLRRENAEQCLALFETLGCLKLVSERTIPHGDPALCKPQTVRVIRWRPLGDCGRSDEQRDIGDTMPALYSLIR